MHPVLEIITLALVAFVFSGFWCLGIEGSTNDLRGYLRWLTRRDRMVKLDDAPWKDEDPAVRRRRLERKQLDLQTFGGGATQFVECPFCFAIVREEHKHPHIAAHWHAPSPEELERIREYVEREHPEWLAEKT